tara:strand:- start:470 stop:1531 length:1062 start_codon:yes stop_codon:yes gene_type:complete
MIFCSSADELRQNGVKLNNEIIIGNNVRFCFNKAENISLGSNISIGKNSFIVGLDKISIGNNVRIGSNSDFRSRQISIGSNTSIGNNMDAIVPIELSFGRNSNIGNNGTIQCRQFRSGDFLQFYDNAFVGKGGKYGVNSKVTIGNGCFVGKSTLLNTSEEIVIGDDVGIGDEAQIWTHGAYLSTIDGFPAAFGSVNIGSNVWLPSRCIVLPNVQIGSNVVIGINSVINKNIPSGCLAGGIPCKVIKENVFPRNLSQNEIKTLIEAVIESYKPLMSDININGKITYVSEDRKIIFDRHGKVTIYDISSMKISGFIDEASEDFRDFLRRNGIKFFTDLKFSSIVPPMFRELMDLK